MSNLVLKCNGFEIKIANSIKIGLRKTTHFQKVPNK